MENTHTIISVGRQYGSGGKEIANAIGSKLGIEVFDNNILVKSAEKSGLSPEAFQNSDEKKRSFGLVNIFAGRGLFTESYGNFSKPFDDSELFKIQSDTIREIASRQNAIFVGRASDYVLREMDCLDVFICAPLEARIERICTRLGLEEEEARTKIAKEDKKRQDYYNFFTMGHWGESSNYDLCIDSSILGIAGTADQIIEFGRKAGLIKQ